MQEFFRYIHEEYYNFFFIRYLGWWNLNSKRFCCKHENVNQLSYKALARILQVLIHKLNHKKVYSNIYLLYSLNGMNHIYCHVNL